MHLCIFASRCIDQPVIFLPFLYSHLMWIIRFNIISLFLFSGRISRMGKGWWCNLVVLFFYSLEGSVLFLAVALLSVTSKQMNPNIGDLTTILSPDFVGKEFRQGSDG